MAEVIKLRDSPAYDLLPGIGMPLAKPLLPRMRRFQLAKRQLRIMTYEDT